MFFTDDIDTNRGVGTHISFVHLGFQGFFYLLEINQHLAN